MAIEINSKISMAMSYNHAYETCKECGISISKSSGWFNRHVKDEHQMTMEEYIVKHEHNGIHPKCQCGLCEEDAFFHWRSGFYLINLEHRNAEWRREGYLRKFGEPKCEICEEVCGFRTNGMPQRFCSKECRKVARGGLNCWNQEKVKQTNLERYGVENVFSVSEIHQRALASQDLSEKSRKAAKARKEKGETFVNEKYRKTHMERYGVEHPSQTEKFREETSVRMKKNNPMFDPEVAKRASETYCEKVQRGEIKLFNTQKYKNTDLYYQSSYEHKFLDRCKEMGILQLVKNGNVYVIAEGKRMITDFSIGDCEIEIKSSYVLKIQGGEDVIDIKRKTVEEAGKQYILILDNDYIEFEHRYGKKGT